MSIVSSTFCNMGLAMQCSTVVLGVCKWHAGALQVSPGGAYVATFDKHSLHIWATRHAERKPLTLHHTKALTVRACCPPASMPLHKLTWPTSGSDHHANKS